MLPSPFRIQDVRRRHQAAGFGRAAPEILRLAITRPFDQLTLADVQQYSQPVSYGISSYELTQWMTAAFIQDRYRLSDQVTIDVAKYKPVTLPYCCVAGVGSGVAASIQSLHLICSRVVRSVAFASLQSCC